MSRTRRASAKPSATREIVRVYDSMAAMIADTMQGPAVDKRLYDPAWYGATSVADAVSQLERGDPSGSALIERIRSIVSQVDASAERTGARSWVPDVVGPRTNVGAYLAGSPYTAYRLVDTVGPLSPIRIVVDPAVSATVAQADIEARGAALAALVMVMSEQRAVELHVATAVRTDGDGVAVTWRVRVDTTPLNISQLAMILCRNTYARAAQFGTLDALTGYEHESIGWHPCNPGAEREAYLRDRLGLDPQDMVIQGLHTRDSETMRRDPVTWVHNQIAAQRGITGE